MESATNINRLDGRHEREEILRQTWFALRVSQSKAESADYVLAVVRGVVVGAFVADAWREATHANFPTYILIENEQPQRKGFRGRVAPEEVWQRFVGERGRRTEVEAMKHVQKPVRYWNIA